MIFDLVHDFSAALAAMPANHAKHRILRLLEEAVRRDIHFIERRPTTLFQCLWNTCWWYDCPEAERHYEPVADGSQPTRARGPRLEPRLHEIMESWREAKTAATPKFCWVRSIRPPVTPLGTGSLAVLRGHENVVHSVAVSPDGQYIASGSDDGTARIWDARGGQLVHCLRAMEGVDNVRKVAFGCDGRRLATGSFSSRGSVVRIWSTETGELSQNISCGAAMAFSPDGRLIAGACRPRSTGVVKGPVGVWDLDSGVELLYRETIEVPEGHAGYVSGGSGSIETVAFSADSRRILTVCPGGSIFMCDARTGEESARLHVRKWRSPKVYESLNVWDAVFSPCGRYIATASNDAVRVWDVETNNEVRCLRSDRARRGGFMSVAFSPDGRHLAAGTAESAVHVWDVSTGDEVACLLGHEAGWVRGVAYFPDGQRLVSGAYDATVRIWDARGGEARGRLAGTGEMVNAVAYRPDGEQVATGSFHGGTLRLWNAATGLEQQCVDRDHGVVVCLAYSPDGRQIAASQDGLAGVWDVATGSNLGWLWQSEHVSRLGYSPDGRMIVSEAYSDVRRQENVTVRTWNAQNGAELKCYEASEFCVSSVDWSPDGLSIAAVVKDKVQVWDAETGNLLRVLRGGRGDLYWIVFAPDSRRAAGVGEDHVARVWDVQTGELLCEFPDNVSRLAFSAHGRWLILGTRDNLVRIRDAQSGEELRVLRGHKDSVGAVACSPDNRLIASGSGDRTVRVWDAQSGAELRCAREHNAPLNGIAFSPDGRRIYGATYPTLRAWDVETGQELPDAWQRCLSGHENMLMDLSVSPDGRIVAAAAHTEHRVRLWDAVTLRELSSLEGHEREATCVAFAPDGRRIVSGARDNTLRIWDATSHESLKVLGSEGAFVTLAPPPEPERFHASAQGPETVVEDTRAGQPAAWFSAPLRSLARPLRRPAWAGVRGDHLCIIALEGPERSEEAAEIGMPEEEKADAKSVRVLPFSVRAFLERDYQTCVVQAYARKKQKQCTLSDFQLMLIIYQRAGQRQDVEQIAREAMEATANQPWDNLLIRITLGDPGANPVEDVMAKGQEAIGLAEDNEQQCQAWYYSGARLLTLRVFPEMAYSALQKALATPVDCVERFLADADLRAMRMDPMIGLHMARRSPFGHPLLGDPLLGDPQGLSFPFGSGLPGGLGPGLSPRQPDFGDVEMQTRATIVNGLGTLTQLMQARDGNRAVDLTLQLWDLALHNLGPDHDTTERLRETLDRVGEFVRLTGSRELALRMFEEMAKICSKYDDPKGQAHALDKQAKLR